MAQEERDAARIFAEHIRKVRYEDLAQNVIDTTKKGILDTVGVILGASGLVPGIKPVVAMVREMGGNEESTLLGFGGRVPAAMAAFVNGAMAHCLDYDDLHHLAKLHQSSSVVPAALAMAERQGKTTGRELITAVAIGTDMSARIALAATWRFPWHMTALTGYFSVAATCSKLVDLEPEQIVDALGIAFCQAAGSMELRWGVGSDLGGMYAAFPAKGGIISTLLAQRGVTGIKNSFEGRAGLFNLYFQGDYNRDILLAELGKRFEGTGTGFKPWPACQATHTYIDATLQLMRENDLKPEHIDEVIIYVGDFAQKLCEPLVDRRQPKTTMDAKYSLPYTEAVAIVKRNVKLGDYTLDSLKNQEVLTMAQRVSPKIDSHFNIGRAVPPGRVDILTTGGKTLSREVTYPYGHPSKPLSLGVLTDKFRECASFTVRRLSHKQIEGAIDSFTHLEEVDNMTEVIRSLC